MTQRAADLVAAARAEIVEISPVEFHATPTAATLLDVREPGEFESGHLPGARNIPRGVLEFQLDAHPELAERATPLVIYCRSGGRAALAAQSLKRLGYANVQSIAGGIEAWQQAGLPLVKP